MSQICKTIRVKYYHLVSALSHRNQIYVLPQNGLNDPRFCPLTPAAHSRCPLLNYSIAIRQIFPGHE